MALAVLGVLTAALMFWLQGYRVYVLHTGSMTPTYPTGALVLDRPAHAGYQMGDVITFARAELGEKVVTHRIVKIASDGLITTKGDGNRTPDASTVTPSQVRGTVMFGAKDLGYVVEFFRHPAGIASLALAIGSFALLWGLFFPDEPGPAASGGIGGVGGEDAADGGGEPGSGRHRVHRPAVAS